MFCRLLFVLCLLDIVLSVLLRFTDSDYTFGIFSYYTFDYLIILFTIIDKRGNKANWFQDIHQHWTRNANNIMHSLARTTFHFNSFLPSTVNSWNELPHTIMSVVDSVRSYMQDSILRVVLWKTTYSKGIWSRILFVLVNIFSYLTTSCLDVLFIHTWEIIFLLTYLDSTTVIIHF